MLHLLVTCRPSGQRVARAVCGRESHLAHEDAQHHRGEQFGLYFEPDGCHVFAPPQPGQGEPAAGQEAGAGAAGDPGTAGEASPAVAGPGLAENTPARTAPPRSPVTAGRRPAGRH